MEGIYKPSIAIRPKRRTTQEPQRKPTDETYHIRPLVFIMFNFTHIHMKVKNP